MIFPNILIVDDEPAIRKALTGILSDEGFDVIVASNGYEAIKMIEEHSPDLVVLDIWMQGMDGIATLKEIKKDHTSLPVIMITGHGNIDTAILAIKSGAYGFLEKPLSADKIILSINNALNFRKIQEENIYLRKKLLEQSSIDGVSKHIKKIKEDVFKIAMSDEWVLIQGESGTGKELVARSIHQLSKRVKASMITVNCVSTTDDLMAKELLGSEKGILGENKSKGAFEIASGGTLFFNEIGDMKIEAQKIITHLLEKKNFKRLGGEREIKFDTRIIASTNQNLQEMIEKGLFREDLFFRLNVMPIFIPPLRERVEDIPFLIDKFLVEASRQYKNKKKRITKDALARLQKAEWKGNVRELKNLINRLCVLIDKNTISITDLPAPY